MLNMTKLNAASKSATSSIRIKSDDGNTYRVKLGARPTDRSVEGYAIAVLSGGVPNVSMGGKLNESLADTNGWKNVQPSLIAAAVIWTETRDETAAELAVDELKADLASK